MSKAYYFPSSELKKPHCQCCAKDLGEFKDKNYLNYRMNNIAVFFCNERCLSYYTKGDEHTKISINGSHIKVMSRRIRNTELCL